MTMNLPHSVDAVLLDLDGTLVDSEEAWFRATARFIGRELSDDERHGLLGSTLDDFVALVLTDRDEPEPDVRVALSRLIDEELDAGVPAMPGADRFVRRLSGVVPLAVASNSPTEAVVRTLSGRGWSDLVDVALGLDDVTTGKPHPDLYLAAAWALGVRIDHCLVVEDSPTGVAAARRAGATVLAVGDAVAGTGDVSVTDLTDPTVTSWAPRSHVVDSGMANAGSAHRRGGAGGVRRVTNPMSEDLAQALDARAARIAPTLGTRAADRFVAMMTDTWTTTMSTDEHGVFVITGDIPAMWLRDSSAQMWPFLELLDVPGVTDQLAAVVSRQWRCIDLDPWANAFNAGPTGAHFDHHDLDLDPGVWERKYEIDSLAFPVDLAHRLWKLSGSAEHLDQTVQRGCRAIVELWTREQDHSRSDYRHVRESDPRDTLGPDGRGTPVAVTGMTWSGFRPSDDACRFGYNIPAQLMAVRALRQIGEFAGVWSDDELTRQAARLSGRISEGVEKFGVVDGHWAYEVDGLGGRLLADDANMPSLLSLPLTSDVTADDPRYLATRQWVLGPDNPYWYSGPFGSGVGSPHSPEGYVWHIALAVQGLTGGLTEGRECLARILATDGGTGWAHESFDVTDPTRYTRPWFSWANSMTCLLMERLSRSCWSTACRRR